MVMMVVVAMMIRVAKKTSTSVRSSGQLDRPQAEAEAIGWRRIQAMEWLVGCCVAPQPPKHNKSRASRSNRTCSNETTLAGPDYFALLCIAACFFFTSSAWRCRRQHTAVLYCSLLHTYVLGRGTKTCNTYTVPPPLSQSRMNPPLRR